MRLRGLTLVVLTIAVLAACSDSTGSSGGRGNTITVSNNSFSPNPDTAAASVVVTFTWSNASNSHNVTWLTGPTTPANSSTMTSGNHVVTLSPGTYTYHCTLHSGMNGTIVVE